MLSYFYAYILCLVCVETLWTAMTTTFVKTWSYCQHFELIVAIKGKQLSAMTLWVGPTESFRLKDNRTIWERSPGSSHTKITRYITTSKKIGDGCNSRGSVSVILQNIKKKKSSSIKQISDLIKTSKSSNCVILHPEHCLYSQQANYNKLYFCPRLAPSVWAHGLCVLACASSDWKLCLFGCVIFRLG